MCAPIYRIIFFNIQYSVRPRPVQENVAGKSRVPAEVALVRTSGPGYSVRIDIR